jgi:hypothetical protein
LSQRFSGYARKERDAYQTPAWVTDAIVRHLRALGVTNVWEPACGDGQIVAALRNNGFAAVGTDILDGNDFLNGCAPPPAYDAIVTNPPFGRDQGRTAMKFIERALECTKPHQGAVAMLLKVDFDSGKTRSHLFAECPTFAGKLVLTERIVWFEPAIAQPSDNHSWFCWSWRHVGKPTISYAPSPLAPTFLCAGRPSTG